VKAQCEATFRMHGDSYQAVIRRVGDHMDALWGNGNWTLLEARAEPQLYNNAGDIVAWSWDFRIRWDGLR